MDINGSDRRTARVHLWSVKKIYLFRGTVDPFLLNVLVSCLTDGFAMVWLPVGDMFMPSVVKEKTRSTTA